MLVYNYNEETKEYLNESEAYIDPEESIAQHKPIFMLPANATFKKPPEKGSHYVYCFIKDNWVKTADYRGSRIINSDMTIIDSIDKLGDIPKDYCLITTEQEEILAKDPDYYIWTKDGLIKNPDYEKIKYKEREDAFYRDFFNSSLGYIRRSVSMKDGESKDFLSDLLPSIAMGVNMGIEVKVIAYDIPDFSKDITDWTKYQHNKVVTPQFIQECLERIQADFGVVKENR